MLRNYGSTATKSMIVEKWDANIAVKMPTVEVAQNANYISSTTLKDVDLQRPTGFCLFRTGSGNYFPLIPLKYPGYDPPGDLGVARSFGAFACKYGTTTAPSAAANVFSVGVMGYDDRFGLTAERRYPNINDYYWSGTTAIPSISNSSAADVTCTVPNGLYITGIWVERYGSSTWWTPMLIIKPTASFPTNSTSIIVRCDLPGIGTEQSITANTLRIRIAGFTTPFPLVKVDISSPAMQAPANVADPVYATASAAKPTGFKLLGAYLFGNNGGNYYAKPWAFTANPLTGTTLPVILAQPLNTANAATRAVAANDVAIRCVGVVV